MSAAPAQEICVKCRGMAARLLSREEYDILMSKKSVVDIADYLKKETSYAGALAGIDERDVHRGQLERAFRKSLYADYERLQKFITGGYRAVIRAMFEAYEVDDLKQVISSLCSANERYLSPEDVEYTQNHGKIPVASLLGAASMDALVESLRPTRYYAALKPFAAREGEQLDFLKIDSALNLVNFRAKMAALAKHSKGRGGGYAAELYGSAVDIENILFVYRIKKLFGYPASRVVPYLIPGYFYIGQKFLYALAECGDVEAMVDMLGKSAYGFLFPKDRESEWEALRAGFFFGLHKKNLHRAGLGAGADAAVSYLYLKETDMKNIIMIVEGVRYSQPASRIASFLIGYGPGARGGRLKTKNYAGGRNRGNRRG